MRFLLAIICLFTLNVRNSLEFKTKGLTPNLDLIPVSCGQPQDDSLRARWPWHGTLHFNQSAKLLREMHPKSESFAVTILTDQFVVTTLHGYVLYEFDRDNVRVRVGQPAVGISDEFTQELPIKQAFLSSEDREEPRRMILFKLEGRLQFSKHVQPICLWSGEDSSLDQIGLLVSFGVFSEGTKQQEIAMPIATKEDCVKDHADFEILYEDSKTFCAGSRNGSGPEPFDAGGGLFVRRENGWFLRGLTFYVIANSIGENQTSVKTNYAMFLDVSSYSNWILETINNNS